MSRTPLRSVGIVMPPDFASADHDAVIARLAPYSTSRLNQWQEFSAGWNGVAFRFLSMAEHDEGFQAIIHGPDARSHLGYYRHDRELYDFFANGQSVIECFSYSLYALGSIADPPHFPTTPAALQGVSPETTRDKFAAYFAGEPVTSEMAQIVDASEFREWKDIRNALTHRISPRRMLFVGGSRGGEMDWVTGTFTVTLNERTTADRRRWLAGAMRDLLQAAVVFCSGRF